MRSGKTFTTMLSLRFFVLLGIFLLFCVATSAWQPQPTELLTHKKMYSTTTTTTIITALLATKGSESPSYPRAAVSVAVRCATNDNNVYYLLVQRGNPPNSGQWSFPGGKLELGETALEGGKRELMEETKFSQQGDLKWHSGTISTADSILSYEDGSTKFHFLIAICFAELQGTFTSLPHVQPADDAADAKWWTIEELRNSSEPYTPGLLRHMERAETLYQSGVL